MKRKLLHFTASFLLLAASAFVLSACYVIWHQPKVPNELLKLKEG
jgi:cyclic lactone autoinducer peptide